jgi:hypothetical protein
MAKTKSRTGKLAARAASKTLRNPKAIPSAKTAAGSALSQTGRAARTGARAASAAGRALAKAATSPAGRRAAASALAQTSSRKKARK